MGGLLTHNYSACGDRDDGGYGWGRRLSRSRSCSRGLGPCPGRIPCNGAKEGVPGGVVLIGRFASEGVPVVWYHR